MGLDPASAALVFVRSPSHFRVSYTPIAARIFLADTPGPTCVNMRRIPFTKVTTAFLSAGSGERLAGALGGQGLACFSGAPGEVAQQFAQARLGHPHRRLVRRQPGDLARAFSGQSSIWAVT